MPIIQRQCIALAAAIIFLAAAVFVPYKWLAFACAGCCLLSIIILFLLLRAGVWQPLKAAAASRPGVADIARLDQLAANAEAEAAKLAGELAQEREKRQEAEEQAASASQIIEEERKRAGEGQAALGLLARQTEELYAHTWKVVQALSQLVGSVAQGVAEQRFRMDEASGSMSLISDNVDQIASSAGSASEQAQSSRSVAISGVQELQVAVGAIEDVNERTLALKETMTTLAEKADNIGRVVGFINDVADQTNLLALNAAIEAARAGESGRGFAVVADEVRNLATKTMQATDEVAQAVSSIQEQTRLTIEAVENAASKTVETAKRAGDAGSSMSFIVENMEQAARQLETIAAATRDQSESSHHTNQALGDIRQVALNTAGNMEYFTSYLVQLTGSMEKLGDIAEALKTGAPPAETGAHLVEWTSSLATGFRIIDEQHKMLLNYINALHIAMRRSLTDEQMLDILNVLYEYTVSHFSTEEQYFTRSDYPNIKSHLEQHHKFTSKIAEFRQAMANGSAHVSMDLLNFLRDWLIHHIQGTDHQYVDSVRRMLASREDAGSVHAPR